MPKAKDDAPKASLFDKLMNPNRNGGPSSQRGSASSSSSGRARGRGRGRGGGDYGGGGWQVRRENYQNIARENEDLHIPNFLRDLPEFKAAVKRSVCYHGLPPPTEQTPLDGEQRKTKFSFENKDSFDAAEPLVKKWGGDKVAVLNMANAYKPGGGYINGASAQEEALCRRSTLYAHIAKPAFYPFHEQGGLWSEGVRIFRQGDDEYCRVLPHDQHFEVNVISVAAIDGPGVNREGTDYLHEDEAELMLLKITAILRIAKLHHQRALVLGAFGCGAFHNPPPAVANLFRRALAENSEFTNTFEEVVFAILERNGSDNLRPWTEVWQSVLDAPGEESAESPSEESVEPAQGGNEMPFTIWGGDEDEVPVVDETPPDLQAKTSSGKKPSEREP